MRERIPTSEIHTERTFAVPEVPANSKRILLLNPPVYDAQYWARWSQPAGLLRIATLLREKGYQIDFVDCMETDVRGLVTRTSRYDVNRVPLSVKRDNIIKPIYHFGLTLQELEQRLRTLEEPD